MLIGDDPSETDDNPLGDGGAPVAPADVEPGPRHHRDARGGVRPEGRAQGHRDHLAKTDTTELERGYTGQRGQDEQNRRARKAAVQSPGKKLDMQTLSGTGGVS